MFTRKEVHWAVSECIRQEVGPLEVENILTALTYAQTMRKMHERPGLSHILVLAGIIEPVKAQDYRKTPVVFNQGEPALNAEHIPRQMILLANSIELMAIDDFVERLLKIHPWADGNGRTASVVYNWMKDSLEDPVPLPYYFGELKEK